MQTILNLYVFLNPARLLLAKVTAVRPQTLHPAPCPFIIHNHPIVKWYRYRPGVAQRVGRGIALLFHDRSTRRGWVVSSTLRPHCTPGKDPVPILQEAGWAQGRSGRAENLVPTGIRSWTVQPVVSRYTDWATPPTNFESRHVSNTNAELFNIDPSNSHFHSSIIQDVHKSKDTKVIIFLKIFINKIEWKQNPLAHKGEGKVHPRTGHEGP